MGGGAAASEQPGRAEQQRTRDDGENETASGDLLAEPAEDLAIVHQGLLTRSARHVKHVQLRRLGEGGVGSQPQAIDVPHRARRLGVDGVLSVRETRKHLKGTGEVDLVDAGTRLRGPGGQRLRTGAGSTTVSRVPAAVL